MLLQLYTLKIVIYIFKRNFTKTFKKISEIAYILFFELEYYRPEDLNHAINIFITLIIYHNEI